MHTIVVGLNYKSAPVEIREKLSFIESELPQAMEALQKQKSILENVIVSTCNRTEIYAVVDQLHTGRHFVKQFLAKWFDLPVETFSSYLTIREEDEAIEHLFKVTAGIDSMVLGETQILGQVKKSFLSGQEIGTTGTVYNQLFKQAVTFAKRAHNETAIGENAVSVSYAAVELAKKIFGSLQRKHVAILGAGKMGELAIENLYGSGVGKVTVINRTFEKAETLAAKFHGEAKSMKELQCSLLEADILITSTGATDFVIDYELMQFVERLRKGKPLFMVDIAVPRDIDPRVGDLPNVFLYDIDDLQGIVEANLAERERAAADITDMIGKEVDQFKDWVATLGVVPVISALRKKANRIQEETMISIENKMPDLTDRERKILSKHTKSIINQLLKEPILQAKELANEPKANEQLRLFQQIFGIEEAVEVEVQEMTKQDLERKERSKASQTSAEPKYSF
ncbi:MULTISPECIES: glutamyl-tRNA reductase [Lysinibacillus]|jgi:glutamyl-tRNA reductase|uniref:Glutamyl-tRNA reductase n=1 Tax=Lysinibacillus fusiformis TaxID=28031 RepID=A0A2I0V1N7_9BACI|nr:MULTISPECIES: glutamyl-tRNA reductase [Lysinibacillus]KUF29942.1 glutamyl-tRNA reductase [Lysinibacillus sp. F5]MEE3805668.1 glutamyl-tRNA reductase [Lysinibacillus fusiformis]PKU52189.1 glutamyl-tRNA reductase [Lysinibacillus fusiformis]SCZ05928.1 glutamyl-tRNA reductase [Lysinibacillus sp. SG9]SDB50175.1 glutamyl-tRNA reductase [Lysinibacillus sp. TC-37]